MITKYGYAGEVHETTTDDGYILTIDRICGKSTENKSIQKPVVLLMPCALGMSSHFVLAGKRSLGFLLSDEGYDVWIGNARGSRYCKRHQTMNRKMKEFWNFSFHEIGIYDLPAIIDFILAKTDKVNLNLVGHSQGSVVFFILMAEKPEYNEKINVMHNLGMTMILSNSLNGFLKLIEPFTFLTNLFNIQEISVNKFVTPWIVKKLFTTKSLSYMLGVAAINLFIGCNNKQYDPVSKIYNQCYSATNFFFFIFRKVYL